MHKADVLSEALGNSRVWAPSPLRSTIDNGLNSGSVGASPTPGSFSRPCPISAQWGPERRRSVSVPMEPLLQLSSLKTGSHFSSFHPWSMGPELVPFSTVPSVVPSRQNPTQIPPWVPCRGTSSQIEKPLPGPLLFTSHNQKKRLVGAGTMLKPVSHT